MSRRACICATAVTIAELRINVPLLVHSPTTNTARPTGRKTRATSAKVRPMSQTYLASSPQSRAPSAGLSESSLITDFTHDASTAASDDDSAPILSPRIVLRPLTLWPIHTSENLLHRK